MPGLDPYNVTNALDETLLAVIATRLENRGKHPVFDGMLQDYVEAMEIDKCGRVLDIGCGTGVAARHIARRQGFSGHVLGVDLSPYLVEAAGKLSEEEGLGTRVAFRAGDTENLGLAEESFDAVIAHTLLSHVSDPAAVLSEAKRVVRSGGCIGVFDGDYASMTFEQENPARSKANDEKVISAVITQPRVMRQIPRLAKVLGLDIVKAFPYVLTEVGQADFWLPAIESFRRLIPKAGDMNETEADAWAGALTAAAENGVFFGSCNYYGYVLRRP